MIRSVQFIVLCSLAVGLVALAASCKPSSQKQAPAVVLYTSADDEFARLIVEQFTQDTGIEVQVVGDTEATKTTGLIARLKAEASRPTADVWWSSEPFGTIDLAEHGVLQPDAMRGLVPESWATELHDPIWSWIGFAPRARVIAYASDRVDNPPTTMRDFVQPQWNGRIGMARPQFGTTRGHMGILAAQWGLPEYERWLTMLKKNNIRLYDGNATVVRAIAMGEIDLALTDTDDVWSGQRNGWAVDCVYERFDSPMELVTQSSRGPTLLPNTVGIIAGGPNPELAKQLAAYLVSPQVEQLLAESDSRNIPINPELSEIFKDIAPESLTGPNPNRANNQSIFPNFSDARAMIPQALDACDRILTR